MNFFFQAEDGIRDTSVTGVQTCALPISEGGDVIGANEAVSRQDALRMMTSMAARFSFDEKTRGSIETRSEERRVGRGQGARVSSCVYSINDGECNSVGVRAAASR